MFSTDLLPTLLGIAVLLPLISFTVIVLFGPRIGKAGEYAAYIATGAILAGFALSIWSLGIWVAHHAPQAAHATVEHHGEGEHHGDGEHHGEGEHHDAHAHDKAKQYYADDYSVPLVGGKWILGKFGSDGQLRLSISYYIDSLTICMFCMVTLIASCIHFYAIGYMHEELHDVEDHDVTLKDGSHLNRPGRYPRFFQYLSLFCFSMLGLVVAGNVAMTFVFWELVGICSYFLIGFYIERPTASTAANKAFIVNRIGDFGMIIGLMALWASLGTLQFGDFDEDGDGVREVHGLFTLVRPHANEELSGSDEATARKTHELLVPEGMVRASAREEVATIVVRHLGEEGGREAAEAEIAANIDDWREAGYGHWLLIVAGVGIFCGCVGKSAQFPLHVWLPDAMEGPTPVSALVHSATMVAAGVFLVGRFFPVFAPEVLLVIAVTGAITLFIAATIAITATDIKRVLAYSTISQLGYMMLSLGLGGWLAGMLHLFTHAFFKSLLFMCSGSVIHAVHTNEMTEMGGLRKKMPWTAYTMLIGCLAIAGAGIPFVIGFSGYYSKDAILEHAMLFKNDNVGLGSLFFYAAAGGAAITAFYMFRLWYLTFAGKPRDQERYDHAHESPPVMYVPLVVLAVFAISVAWTPREGILGAIIAVLITGGIALWRRSGDSDAEEHGEEAHGERTHDNGAHASTAAIRPILIPVAISLVVLLVAFAWLPAGDVVLSSLLEQSRPDGTRHTMEGKMVDMVWRDEHLSHAPHIKTPATLIAFGTAMTGFLLATLFYAWRWLDVKEVREQFRPIYRFLLNKWWFDELYDVLFVRPVLFASKMISSIDKNLIDRLIDGSAFVVRQFCEIWEYWIDRTGVDGLFNLVASWTYSLGLSARRVQTGRLRQYVMFIVVGTVAIFALVSFFWSYTLAR